MHGEDLTKGNIGQQLWRLAWPMMLSMFFYTLYNLVDAFWVSKISPEAIAAVSISQITLFLMISLGFGITIGSGVIMSMHIGAHEKKEAERVLGQSFVLAMIAGVLFTAIALLFRKPLLIVSGAAGDIFAPAMSYFTITAAASILFFILITIMFAFNAQGDTMTLTKLFAISTFANLLLDPLFIFTWDFGISGAAIATVISQAIFIVIALRSLSREDRMVRFHFRNLTFVWESVKKVLKIGIPAAITQVIFPIGLAGLTLIASIAFSEVGAIAMSLGFRVEFFAFLPAGGFGFAAMAMMGQSIGAEKKDRARKVFKKAILYSFVSAMGLGILVAVFSKWIIAVFTTDPLVVSATRGYMLAVTLTYGFLTAGMVCANAFQAIGRSWPGFWILFLKFVVIAIPISYVFTVLWGFSIKALWISLILGNVLSALFGYWWITRTLRKLDLDKVPVHGHENV